MLLPRLTRNPHRLVLILCYPHDAPTATPDQEYYSSQTSKDPRDPDAGTRYVSTPQKTYCWTSPPAPEYSAGAPTESKTAPPTGLPARILATRLGRSKALVECRRLPKIQLSHSNRDAQGLPRNEKGLVNLFLEFQRCRLKCL